jgi:hypothetical protein
MYCGVSRNKIDHSVAFVHFSADSLGFTSHLGDRMWRFSFTVGVTALALFAFGLAPVAGAASHNPADVSQSRRQLLETIQTGKDAPWFYPATREACAVGHEPANVAKDRGEGADFTPDASDECVAVLIGIARTGGLNTLYQKLLTQAGGSAQAVPQFAHAVGAAVLKGSTQVPIGNGKAAQVSASLSFDAGFTAAYQDGQAARAPDTSAAQLKPIAEACLNKQQDAGTCFSVGYVYGMKAYRGWSVLAG